MIRLHITAEGQTEQVFSKEILAPHLAEFGVYVDARCVLTSKDKRVAKEYRGGLRNYEKAKKDIIAWLKEDDHTECWFTTMFDLYALPNDFPDYVDAKKENDPYKRVQMLEQGMERDINSSRFISYIQLHEFEALILADPQKLDFEYLEHDMPIRNLIRKIDGQNPELINDGPATAPSKRILNEIPEYDKVTAGVSIVGKIGLQTLRDRCHHFNDWLTTLEQLAENSR